MKRLTIVIGAGGTGSYFIPNIVRQYNNAFIDNKIIVLDGDHLEERNLLRQGFFKNVIDFSKSEAMYKMHGKHTNTFIDCRTQFLNSADELLNIVAEQTIEFQEIVLVSCVDNNLARLRLLLGQQLIKEAYPDKRVLFADSGNEEWFGQTLLSFMDFNDKAFISFKNNEFTLIKENINENTFDTLFAHITDWKNHLTRGDHELSCDDVVESAPQNIATNMMASNVLLFSINKALNKQVISNVYFDCKMNLTKELEKSNREVLETFFEELVEYLLSPEVTTVLSDRFLSLNKDSEVLYTKKRLKINTHQEIVKADFNDLKQKFVKELVKKTKGKTKKSKVVSEDEDIFDLDIPSTEMPAKKSNASFDLNIDDILLDDFDKLISKPKKVKKENDFDELDSFMKSINFDDLF